jgi:integrase/recombinase XerD
MARKRITKTHGSTLTFDMLYMNFLAEKRAMGISESSIKNYEEAVRKFREFTKEDVIDKAIVIEFIASLQEQYSSVATINHYIRQLRAVVYYCIENGMETERFKISTVKGQESVKATYTDEELKVLLEKPSDDCSFTEYRNWMIVQVLLGTGIRAATLLNIRLKDICLPSKQLILSHTKNKKAQIVPLSTSLCRNLKTYISLYREQDCNGDSYLFPNVYDEQMNHNALRLAIGRYNRSRGVQKTSIHLFRHTFAKMWIMNHGDAITLQKMLGHSSMEMTRRYVNLYSVDLNKDFDNFCPLENMMPKSKKHSIK